jgi:hypothetical protein
MEVLTNYECSSGKGDSNCVNCALLKIEFLSISLEVKSSAHQIITLLQDDINTLLKREHVQANTPVRNKQRNEEGIFSLVNSKSRKRTSANLNKQSLSIPKKLAPPSVKTVNHFEALHNLNEEGSQEALARKSLSTQFCTSNSDLSKQQRHINDPSDRILVIINGRTTVETKKKNTICTYKRKCPTNSTMESGDHR